MIWFTFENQRCVRRTCVTWCAVLLAALCCCNGGLDQATAKTADPLPSASESSSIPDTTEQLETAAVDLGSLLDAGVGAVVTLVSGNTQLAAHRAVLTAGSTVLADAFRHDTLATSSREIAVPDVEGPVLRQLVAFLYTGRAPQLPGMAPQLLAAADRYGVSALRDASEQQVLKQLDVEGAAAAAVVAVRHARHALGEAAVAFIRAHIFEVLATHGWEEAVINHPREVVQIYCLLSAPPAKTRATTTADSTATPTATLADADTAFPAAAATTIDSTSPSTPATPTATDRPHSEHGRTAATAPLPTAGHHTPLPEAAAVSVLHTAAIADSVTTSTTASTATLTTADITSTPTAAAPTAAPTAATTATPAAAESTSTSTATTSAAPKDCHYNQPPDAAAVSSFRTLSAKEKGMRLIGAAHRGAVQEVRALLAAGANVRARNVDWFDYTAMHYAAFTGHVEVVQCLLQAGAEVDARDKWQVTPLHLAAEKGYTAVVQLLLASSAHPNARAASGETPLYRAAAHGRTAVVRLLLAASADPNTSNGKGSTPLHIAAMTDRADVAAALLQAGANRGVRDSDGQTALDYARRYDRPQVVQLLQ